MKATSLPHHKVAERLKARRIFLNLSQRDLSIPGATYAYISRIEAGLRRPSLEVVIALAAKLGMTGLELLTGDRHAHCPLCNRGASNGHRDAG